MKRWLLGCVTTCFLASLAWGQIVSPPYPYVVNPAAPTLQGLTFWWLVLPHIAAGANWYPLVGHVPGTLTNMDGSNGFQRASVTNVLGEVRFGGTDDYINFGTDARWDFVNTSVTLHANVRCTGSGSTNYLWSKRLGAGSDGGYFVRISSGGALVVRILESTNLVAAERSSTTSTLCDGTWRPIAVVLTTDGVTVGNNNITIYINGRLDQGSLTTGSNPHSPCLTCRFLFGTTEDIAAPLVGAADDLRIWNRALSEREISEVHNQRPPNMGDMFVLPGFGYSQAVVMPRRKVIIQ